MTEQQIGAYIFIYGFAAFVTCFAFWLGEREERKARERHKRLYSNLNIISNMGTGKTLEQTASEWDELKKRLKVK